MRTEDAQTPFGEILTMCLLIEGTGYLRVITGEEAHKADMTTSGVISLPVVRDERSGQYYLYPGIPTPWENNVRDCNCQKNPGLMTKLLGIIRR